MTAGITVFGGIIISSLLSWLFGSPLESKRLESQKGEHDDA
jgi:hypothetical protein